MPTPAIEVGPVMPELILVGVGVILLLAGVVARKISPTTLLLLCLVGIAAAAVAAVRLWDWDGGPTVLAIARGLFDDEVTVEHDRLQARQQVVVAVDVRPAHLRATNHRIGKEVDQLAQAIGLGNEVGVEDREQFAFGRLVSVLERAGFEAGAIRAMDVVNVKTLRRIFRDDRFGDFALFRQSSRRAPGSPASRAGSRSR